MPNELAKKGSQPSRPPKYGVLWNNSFYDGIVTQRNPLRSNAAHIEAEFYGERTECLIDGLNTEISTKLTLVRRPGSSPYQTTTGSYVSDTYPAIDRFYSWHLFNSNTEQIKVLADNTPSSSAPNLAYPNGAVYNVPPAGTSIVSPTPLFVKSAGAGKSSFLGVGNTLYLSDGIDNQKIVESLISWTKNTNESAGTYIIDGNNNIQVAIGSQTASVSYAQIIGTVATLFLTSSLDIPVNTKLNLGTLTVNSGSAPANAVTAVAAWSNTTQTITGVPNSQQVQFTTALGSFNYTPTTAGSVTTGTGETGPGPGQPSWSATPGNVTQDGTAQWLNAGLATENWGIAAPVNAPTVAQIAASTATPGWLPATWYAPLFVISDGANLQQLTFTTTSASPPTWKTGTSHPTWSTTPGAPTSDNNGSPSNPALWTCLGTGAWSAGATHAVGDIIQANYVYYVTTSQPVSYPPYYVLVQTPVHITELFQCTTAGTSGTTPPIQWSPGLGSTTTDGSGATPVVWTNMGTLKTWPGATQTLSLATQVLDTNYNLQNVVSFAESETPGPPLWSAAQGSYTTEPTGLTWQNAGPSAQGTTGAWIYAYSYVNSVTDTVSTADPQSVPILITNGNVVTISGIGSFDPQVNEIYIWRTVQGGSTLFYLDAIPNPPVSSSGLPGSWSYIDTTPDTGLNELMEAPVDFANNPPPVGISALVYHLERIWGAVNNSVYFSAGPDALVGSGDEAWPPANVFVFPDTVIRMFPTTSGLYVFTTADIYLIQGLGTSSSSFFSTPFMTGIGLSSYDAFAVNGSIVFLYSSDNQILTLDPSSGLSEIGFPIGDQFPSPTFTALQTQLTWHVSGSADKGLYVSDYADTWWRMCPTPSPETGTVWSPKAQIVSGFSAVQSVETSSGVHTLLIGPPPAGGPILKRDSTVWTDDGTSYPAWAILGSLVLAQPGQTAHTSFFTTDSVKVGTPLTLAVQLDEIAPVTSGYFEPLTVYTTDPPQLSPSLSVEAQRFWLSQTEEPALCRHLQVQVNFGLDVVKNELLSLSLFGDWEQEV